MDYNEELCKKFSNNPKINPETEGYIFDKKKSVKYVNRMVTKLEMYKDYLEID